MSSNERKLRTFSFTSVPGVPPARPLTPGRRPTADLQPGLELGLVLNGEPPQCRDKSGVAALEVRVGEVVVGGTVLGRQAAVSTRRIHLPEAVEVELPDEAGEVLGLEGVQAVCAGREGRQDLPLKELPIDDDGLALTVPENGPDRRVAHQAP